MQLTKILKTICSPLFEKYFIRGEEKWTMQKIKNASNTFKYLFNACYAIDDTFQQSSRPSNNMNEGKVLFRKI